MMPTLTSFTDTLVAGHPGGAPGKAAPRKGQVTPLPGHVAPVTPRQPGVHGESGFAALLTGPVAPVMPQQPGVAVDHGVAPRLPDYVTPVMPQQPGRAAENDPASLLPGYVKPVMPQQPGMTAANDAATLPPALVPTVMPRQPGEDGGDGVAALLPGAVAPVMPRQPSAAGNERGVVLLPEYLSPVSPRQGDGEGGNGLPASTGNDDDGNDFVQQPGGWIAPPIWLVTCSPPAPVAGGALPVIASPIAAAPALTNGAVATGEAETVPADARIGAAPGAAAALPPATEMVRLAPGAAPPAASAAVQPSGILPVPPQNVAAPSFSLAPPVAPDAGQTATQLSVTPVAPAPAQSAAVPAADAAALRVGTDPVSQREADGIEPVAANRLAPIAKSPAQVEPLVSQRQVAPAAQMFAAAIHRASRDERRVPVPDAMIAGLAPTAELTPQAAVEHSRHAALDMARATWPAKMIERIEMMRDALDAADTSIRLMPDKLGTIDVSLRREGDGVAVQFTAQQAETRQLLAEAQPKLAELAEAKGLKLSAQAGGDPGQQQQSQGQRAPASAPPSSYRSAQTASSDAAGVADERIA